jgi:hypothetical protein
MQLKADNHSVPKLYLKHFASADDEVHCYRTLVSRSQVPSWKKSHISSIGKQIHLYTRALADRYSDETERWLDKEFESPAEKSISKVVQDEPLSKGDYRFLVRFLIAQMVRTPAYFLRHRHKWRNFSDEEFGRIPREITSQTENLHSEPVEGSVDPLIDYFPISLRADPLPDNKGVKFNTRIFIGRSMWVFVMRHILTNTVALMEQHRWTILSTERDLPWFTTDDPVVCLNFRSPSNYDFEGKWNVARTIIFLPLSPRHLLFTEVGKNRFDRGEVLNRDVAKMLRRIIAEHAHRYIYSPTADKRIEQFRARIINPEELDAERQFWNEWHNQQSCDERTWQSSRISK